MRGRTVGTKHQLNTEEIFQLFRPVEGNVSFYYGNIRNGKTYAATADILELLARGEIVIANWPVAFSDFDERKDWRIVLVKLFFRMPNFYVYKGSNFHYIHPDQIDSAISQIGRMVNVHVFIDEGQWIFNSHVRNPDPEKRKLILHNGHYCRSLNIISQRPSNIFKDMRSQVNIWYKCEKRLTWPFLVFQKTEFQQMKEDLPDEEFPVGRPKIYIANKTVQKAYNTHAMRGADAIEKIADFDVYRLTIADKLYLMFDLLAPAWIRAPRLKARARVVSENIMPEKSIRNIKK